MEGIYAQVERLARADNSQEDDYIDADGYRICAKCHTRKQMEIELFGERRRVPVMCRCRQEQWEEDARRSATEHALARVSEMRKQGIADNRYRTCRFAQDDRSNPKLSETMRQYCRQWAEMSTQNIGLLLYGGVGTGKTFWAACIANDLIEHGIPVLMSNFPTLITAMREDYERDKSRVLERVASTPLVILDDLGVERGTEFVAEKMYEIVDTRYRAGRPLIVTTNLSKAQLTHPDNLADRRLYDRILEMCVPILVDGDSRRTAVMRQKQALAANLLK